MKEIGIVGINSRAVAASARRLGFDVHLVDYFTDVDIEADFHYPLQEDPLMPDLEGGYSPEKLVDLAIENLGGRVDSLLITADLGCNPRLIKKLEKHFEILGNGSKQVARAKDWSRLKRILGEKGISHPRTTVASSFMGMKNALIRFNLPVVVKTLVKGTGIAPALIESLDDIEGYRDMKFEDEVLLQEYVVGEAISASVLSNGEQAVTLSVNKQLIGVREFGTEREFAYCGNLVPLDHGDYGRISDLSSELVSGLELSGSNGVDYILSNNGRLYFMEVNTRFQDTLEGVERFRKVNLVEGHLKAIEGRIEIPKKRSKRFFGKGILYANRDLKVGDLTKIGNVGDIPVPGARIRREDPLCSIYASGRNSNAVFSDLLKKAGEIRYAPV
jgi:predicted ATP-grasp superfamily ATP-dependent carboligase